MKNFEFSKIAQKTLMKNGINSRFFYCFKILISMFIGNDDKKQSFLFDKIFQVKKNY